MGILGYACVESQWYTFQFRIDMEDCPEGVHTRPICWQSWQYTTFISPYPGK
jgi:hypothetical protein